MGAQVPRVDATVACAEEPPNAGLGPNTVQFCERLEMLTVLRAAKVIKRKDDICPMPCWLSPRRSEGHQPGQTGLSGRGSVGQGHISGIAKRLDDADSLAESPWGIPSPL